MRYICTHESANEAQEGVAANPAARGCVVIVHGVGEHSGRYSHVIDHLRIRGYSAICGDLPGHGRASGRRAHVNEFREYTDAVDSWVRSAINTHMPVFLVGHSLGSLICMRYVQTMKRASDLRDLRGLVLSAPPLRLALPVPGWKLILAAAADALMPTLAMSNELDPRTLSRDEGVVRAYVNDPLVYRKVTARWYAEFRRASQSACAESLTAGSMPLPTFAVIGGADATLDVEWIARHFNSLDNVEFVRYEGLYHEVFNEPEKARVLDDITDWMDARSADADVVRCVTMPRNA